jgi:hypothetical protein
MVAYELRKQFESHWFILSAAGTFRKRKMMWLGQVQPEVGPPNGPAGEVVAIEPHGLYAVVLQHLPIAVVTCEVSSRYSKDFRPSERFSMNSLVVALGLL